EELLGMPWANQLSNWEMLPPMVPKAPIFHPGRASSWDCRALTRDCMAAMESFFGAISALISASVCAMAGDSARQKRAILKILFMVIVFTVRTAKVRKVMFYKYKWEWVPPGPESCCPGTMNFSVDHFFR